MGLEIKSDRLNLRMARNTDAAQIVRYFTRNKERFAGTRQRYAEDFFTERHWLREIDRMNADFEGDRAACFFLEDPASKTEFVGSVNFSNFVRGAFQACYLGYSIDADYEGKGYMTECVSTGITFVFDELNMHRIMANYRPENKRSERLLVKLGFEKEGIAKDYLFLDGKWCDHILTSISNLTWRERL